MTPIAWGARVSEEFRNKVRSIANIIGIDPSDLMTCMAFETGKTFSPSIQNAAGSGATGLIQFMPTTAAALGTSTDELAEMTDVEQLKYVERYFRPWIGKLKTLEDIYMAILWPAAVGKPNSYVLFDKADPKHPKRYIQNAGLDFNADGKITKAEATYRVRKLREEGMFEKNVA